DYAVRADAVTRVDAATKLPYDVGESDAWMEISIARQSLVLYRGLTPIFVTLVSTGADGAGDVATTRSTPRGWFRIYSKHVTYRMSADEHPPWTEGAPPDPRYRIDDVPYVQYFQGGYALHAAYWHDSFGQPKSHGCVNLSPRDALWLFTRTTPDLPEGWYGVYSGRAGSDKGTVVVVKEW
ncbi:MAG: L,D-transpeptidase, partial [Polyangiales bacterium]